MGQIGYLMRVDIRQGVGLGHLMRCLAISQALKRQGRNVPFVFSDSQPTVERLLRSKGIEYLRINAPLGSREDGLQTVRLARRFDAAWVIQDGYPFDSVYQQTIKSHGLHLLAIDDCFFDRHYFADIVLNQNAHARPTFYRRREPYTRLLVGTRYALLRPEFTQWRGWKRRVAKQGKRILVTLGGSHQARIMVKIISALQNVDLKGLEIVAVIGFTNRHLAQLRSAVERTQLNIRLETNASDLSGLMAWADIAISAGGSTSWELAWMGLPTLMVVLAENQRPSVERLAEQGCVINLGTHRNLTLARLSKEISRLLSNQKLRSQMSRRFIRLVDGRGVDRVLKFLRR